MADKKLHVGDIGTIFELTVKEGVNIVDVSNASTKDITLSRPDETTVVRAAGFFSDGLDGTLTFTIIADDLSMEGTYFLQAYLVLPSWSGYSDSIKVKVQANLG